jgi:hypothetical protein
VLYPEVTDYSALEFAIGAEASLLYNLPVIGHSQPDMPWRGCMLEASQSMLRCKIVEKFGSGGMIVVYNAEDAKFHRHDTLKSLWRSQEAIKHECASLNAHGWPAILHRGQ